MEPKLSKPTGGTDRHSAVSRQMKSAVFKAQSLTLLTRCHFLKAYSLQMPEMFNPYLGKEWKISSHKSLQCYYCSLLTGDGVSFQRDSHTVAARISWQRRLPGPRLCSSWLSGSKG